MMAAERVSAIVVAYESGETLFQCLASLSEQAQLTEVIVVDNGARDGSVAAAARKFPGLEIVRPGRNLGFAMGANEGARGARGELLLFLNPDVSLGPGCLDALACEFDDPSVAVVGPSLTVGASGGAVEYGATVDRLGSPIGLPRPRAPFFVPGCALMTPRARFLALGGFDARYFMFVEDVDYCWRVRLSGFDVRVALAAEAFHAGGASAPGGYPTAEGIKTTAFRVVLRERNTLATLLKCYAAPRLAALMPLYLLQLLATASLLALAGKRRTALEVVGTLAWNGRELRRTLRLRRSIQRGRSVSDRELASLMHPRLRRLELLGTHGIPEIAEADASSPRIA
jgi:GT2 family glycosyltransferase